MGIEVAKVITEWRKKSSDEPLTLRAAAAIFAEKVFPITAAAICHWEAGEDMPRHVFIELMRRSGDPDMAALGEKLEAARTLDLQSSDTPSPSPAQPDPSNSTMPLE